MPSRSRSTSSSPSTDGFTIPGVDPGAAAEVRDLLQQRLIAMADLTSTLKHVHWNVVGPHFIAVHEMLDPQYEAAAEMVDNLAERIAALGGSPNALAGAVVEQRTWDEYAVGRAPVEAHLAALDLVYDGVITDHRAAIEATESSDPVTQDLLIAQSGQLEQFQWFVRAHLESSDGHLAHEGATSERDAARRATAGSRRR